MDLTIFRRLRFLNQRNARRRYRAHLLELRLKSSPFHQLTDKQFKKLFRLDKNSTRELIGKLENFAGSSTIPFRIVVLTALHFFAQGSYQASIGSNSILGLSQPSVSRCIKLVTELIVEHLMDDLIKFPRTFSEKVAIQQGFQREFGMCCVIGAIDGSHFQIVSPPEMDDRSRGNDYINRKGQHSINVLAICDSNLKILFADARFPGSTHDSAIWLVSPLRRYLKNRFTTVDRQDNFLFGDSGFPLEPWLLTPFRQTTADTAEHVYNKKFVKTRQVIEWCFGVIKSRFRCLHKQRVLHYSPQAAGKIIYAVFCLHNICMSRNLYEDLFNSNESTNDEEDDDDDEQGQGNLNRNQWLTLGTQTRERYMRNL